MKACSDIDFLDSYWNEAKNIAIRIKNDLNQFKEPNVKSKESGLMYIIKYSDLGNSWGVDDILTRLNGRSPTLGILADKIAYMIIRGNGNSVKPMLKKIITGRIKHFKKPPRNKDIRDAKFNNEKFESEPLGHGHFRWNREVHTLTKAELNHIKKYFKL